MTKTRKYKLFGLRKITFVIIVAAALSTQAFCQDEIDEYVLMIQQTPVGAGRITPATGVHNFTANEKITITAMPKPGYIFLYWLGSVDDMTTNRTTVLVDAPKIVIAVFERAEFALLTELESLRTGMGRGGASNRGDGFSMGRASNPGPSPRVFEPPEIPNFVFDDVPIPDDDPEDDLPIPEDDFPVPDDEEYIPEPATIILLGFGAVLARTRKNKKQQLAKVNEDTG
jgi:hypothetical protein